VIKYFIGQYVYGLSLYFREKGKDSKRCFVLQFTGEEEVTRGPSAWRISPLKFKLGCGVRRKGVFFLYEGPPPMYREWCS
jgi:hypothetical protein